MIPLNKVIADLHTSLTERLTTYKYQGREESIVHQADKLDEKMTVNIGIDKASKTWTLDLFDDDPNPVNYEQKFGSQMADGLKNVFVNLAVNQMKAKKLDSATIETMKGAIDNGVSQLMELIVSTGKNNNFPITSTLINAIKPELTVQFVEGGEPKIVPNLNAVKSAMKGTGTASDVKKTTGQQDVITPGALAT